MSRSSQEWEGFSRSRVRHEDLRSLWEFDVSYRYIILPRSDFTMTIHFRKLLRHCPWVPWQGCLDVCHDWTFLRNRWENLQYFLNIVRSCFKTLSLGPPVNTTTCWKCILLKILEAIQRRIKSALLAFCGQFMRKGCSSIMSHILSGYNFMIWDKTKDILTSVSSLLQERLWVRWWAAPCTRSAASPSRSPWWAPSSPSPPSSSTSSSPRPRSPRHQSL